MYNRQNRKKQNPNSLINLEDFVRFRSEKEKILKNPLEQNWKKAIALEEMLQLYKVREGNYVSGGVYDKKNFSSYYKYRKDRDVEDTEWQNNEDYQFKKYYRMAEGMENFDQAYLDQRMTKTAKQVEVRGNLRGKDECYQIFKAKNIYSTSRCKKQKRSESNKNKLQSFQSLICFKQLAKKSFKNEKNEIFRLKKKAIKVYGVKFECQMKTVPQEEDVQGVANKDREIQEKFMNTMKTRVISRDQNVRGKQLVQCSPNPHLPVGLLIKNKSSCPVSPRRTLTTAGRYARKNRYLRIM